MQAPSSPASRSRAILSKLQTDKTPAVSPATTLWLLNGDLVSEARVASLASALGTSERERYARFLRPQRAREFLLGRMLLRHAAHTILGIAATDISITEREGNAPLLSLPHPADAFHFSLSHSHRWVACIATMAGRIGIDIERKDRPRDIAAMSAAVFDRKEQEWMSRLPAHQREPGFYRLWNNKEALYKLATNVADDIAETSSLKMGAGWNCRSIDHPELFIGICSTFPLADMQIIELTGL